MLLKHVQEEEQKNNIFDTILFWFLGIMTVGLYFVFWWKAEKKKFELGTEYYECEVCGFTMSAQQITNEDLPKVEVEKLDKEEQKELRKIAERPVDMNTWRKEREKAVLRKRKKAEKLAEKERKNKKNV